MQIGMNLPVMVPGLDRDTVESWCRAIDAGPFSTLAAGERINFPNPEILVTLSTAAAWTTRVRLLFNVLVLPMHPEVLIAKQVATLDRLSNGRVRLGVGTGGREDDYAAVGAQWKGARLTRLEKQVARMRRIWSGEERVEGALNPVEPTPVRPEGPELLAGSIFPKGITRAARWADGLSAFSFGMGADELRFTFDTARTAWGEAGRPTPPTLAVGCFFALGADARAQMDRFLARYLDFMGPGASSLMSMVTTVGADGVREALARAKDAGADEVLLTRTTADATELQRVCDLVG